MHGNTKKERDNYYKQNMSKAIRMIRYIGKIISTDIYATNCDIFRIVKDRQPSFNKVTWEFINIVRIGNYNRLTEQDIITSLLSKNYISKSDLYIRRRNKNE
jgi:hypothetical protein